MLLRKIYETVVAKGIEKDPRGKDTVKKTLEKRVKTYENMKEDERNFLIQKVLQTLMLIQGFLMEPVMKT